MKHEFMGNDLLIIPDDPLAASTINPLHNQLLSFFSDPTRFQKVIVDLSGVQIIDSLGVNLLVGLYKECRKHGKAYIVTGCTPSIRRLFDLYKLTTYFGIE
jgi:anti-anti-sigma factor